MHQVSIQVIISSPNKSSNASYLREKTSYPSGRENTSQTSGLEKASTSTPQVLIMQQFKDANGNAWGDFSALNKKTNISAKTAASWVADGIFQSGLHYARQDDGSGKFGKIYYRLDLCAELHKQRVKAHANNLKAGKYARRASESSTKKKHQINMMLASHEVEILQILQESGDFVRCKEVKCGDLVLRSEAQPLSITSIAAELLRKTLKEETVKIFGKDHEKKFWLRRMIEDWHNYSLRYQEWLEDTVDESEVLPEDRAEVYYLEARRRSLWRRLLNVEGRVMWTEWVNDLSDAQALIDEATDAGYVVTIEAQPLR